MTLSRRLLCKSSLGLASTATLLKTTPLLAQNLVASPHHSDLLRSFAFGSCNRQDEAQDHWDVIAGLDPQAWIWMGDAIYADDASPSERAREYRKLTDHDGYRDFSTSRYLLGTWDDHDYAFNNAGQEYRQKDGSKRAFLDFLGEANDSPRRGRPGVFDSKLFGPDQAQVQVVLLDLRYFKPRAGRDADLLGREQWDFLENELASVTPALRVFVSSFQCLTDFDRKETWEQYPASKSRFLDLLREDTVPNLIMSGDRHLAEFSALEFNNGRKIYEVTSSGLTHSTDRTNDNRYRIGRQVLQKNFGMVNLIWDETSRTPTLEQVQVAVHSPRNGDLLGAIEF